MKLCVKRPEHFSVVLIRLGRSRTWISSFNDQIRETLLFLFLYVCVLILIIIIKVTFFTWSLWSKDNNWSIKKKITSWKFYLVFLSKSSLMCLVFHFIHIICRFFGYFEAVCSSLTVNWKKRKNWFTVSYDSEPPELGDSLFLSKFYYRTKN